VGHLHLHLHLQVKLNSQHAAGMLLGFPNKQAAVCAAAAPHFTTNLRVLMQTPLSSSHAMTG
jgi:hypothetical protein